MSDATTNRAGARPDATRRSPLRGRLFRKYATLVASVVCAALLANGAFNIWLSYREHKASLISIQREQAEAAADKIGQFMNEIDNQLVSMTQRQWSVVPLEEQRLEALRLLRRAPAITEIALLDATGRERLRISRTGIDVVGSQRDLSQDAAFLEARARGVYHGPVYFRRDSEPYLRLARTGSGRDSGVAVAEINLVFVWDVVSQIKVGKQGRAYAVDAAGRLIAHPDISLVLRNTDVSGLRQVQAARADAPLEDATDLEGRHVLAAHASIPVLGWLVIDELPLEEAYAPVYASILSTGLVLLAALALAVFASFLLVRSMVTPIRALQTGAARVGSGALDHRIHIESGDELEALGDQFNSMAAQLQDSYATLERKVEERTHQLELANLAKSRFLAAASHDLRQPLHALNLFFAQLRSETDQAEKTRLVAWIDGAIASMNELFNALLDISKLDAGVLAPNISEFPVDRLLKRIETTFVTVAREKGLRLRVLSSRAFIRSDFILLERVLLNLISNATRYTMRGGIVVGCRRRGEHLRLEVWDSGIGIPEDQRSSIFAEFYQISGSQRDRRDGLGLGLAIVDRLCRLLEHPVSVTSRVGKGSCFSITVPLAAQPQEATGAAVAAQAMPDPAAGKVVVVIDDDALVLEGMRGVLKSWGCNVVTAGSEAAALANLTAIGRPPDLIISDYRLGDGKTGFEVIEQLRRASRTAIPAFLISGDTAPERLREANASGYYLLHKPVPPITLRATVSRVLQARGDADHLAESVALSEPSRAQPAATTPSPSLPPR